MGGEELISLLFMSFVAMITYVMACLLWMLTMSVKNDKIRLAARTIIVFFIYPFVYVGSITFVMPCWTWIKLFG